MPEPRLATWIWVSAYLARLQQANIPAYVTARGDPTAGAVLVKCALLDGTARLYGREWDFDSDSRPWRVLVQGAEPEVDQAAGRQRRFDPDLWVVEIESRDGRTLLDEAGLT